MFMHIPGTALLISGLSDLAWLLGGAFWGFTALALLVSCLIPMTVHQASAKAMNSSSRLDGVLNNLGSVNGQLGQLNIPFLSGLHQGITPSGPSSAPSSYNQTWGINITSVLNNIIATLGTGGVGVWP